VDETGLARVATLLGTGVAAARGLGGQHGVRHYRLTLADGRTAFAKIHTPSTDGNVAAGFPAEASGLRWLADAAAVAVPAVLAADETCLVIEWVTEVRPTPATAEQFGRELAVLHSAGAGRFGAQWPGTIAGLPLPNDAASGAQWPAWYAASRVLPYVRLARAAGSLTAADVTVLEAAAARTAEVSGPPEPPARIHGDLWSGNVLWSQDRATVIDPAAHGGHRETDLAMLALFGAPYLDRIMDGYASAAPLAAGWRDRVPLHQLHPLLVHVCLFGRAYRDSALAAAQHVLAL
jgi:fructosamine-3-kinase